MIRRKAADALGKRGAGSLPTLLTLLETGTPEARIGAIHAIGAIGEAASSAAPAVLAVIGDADADLWLRSRALIALQAIGDPTRETLESLLHLALTEKPTDPRRDLDMELAAVIAKMIGNPYESDLDLDLFHAAANKLLTHPHHAPRNQIMRLLGDVPLAHFHAVADRIVEVIRNDSPHYETYHNDAARVGGLNILERLNIRDGITLAVATLKTDKWGRAQRIYGSSGRIAFLRKYGAEAQSVLPELQALREAGKLNDTVDPHLAAIAKSTKKRDLISLEEAIRVGRAALE